MYLEAKKAMIVFNQNLITTEAASLLADIALVSGHIGTQMCIRDRDYREKEHAFITIEKDLKGGKVPRVVLLCGSEEYLIEWYAQTLIHRYVSDACRALDLVRLEGDSLTLERIREGLETVSLMSERKVVFLPDFLPAAGKAVRGFPESDCKVLAEYLDV